MADSQITVSGGQVAAGSRRGKTGGGKTGGRQSRTPFLYQNAQRAVI